MDFPYNNPNANELLKLQQQIAQLESIVKARSTKDAITRLSNIRSVDQQKYVSALVLLAQGLQTGRVEIIDDETLKSLLMEMAPKRRDFTIKRV